jgi:hypothetical protein
MRLAFAASALCLISLVIAGQPATSQTSPPSTAQSPSSAPVNGDAAAKHVKRTACLRETRAKKLVGAEKTAFLKSCIDAPPGAISASRISPPNQP